MTKCLNNVVMSNEIAFFNDINEIIVNYYF